MPILLFDGVCNVCNASVDFVLRHDRNARVRLGALQSPEGQALLERHGLSGAYLDSLVLIEDDGKAYVKSDAVVRLARYLAPPFPLLAAFGVLPRALRDRLYDLVARNRYRWFGVRDTCRLATPEERARFL